MREKISTGPNARPKNETIAGTGPGLPDDTSQISPDISSDEKIGLKPPDPPAHQLQQDPAEGSDEVIERELKRQDHASKQQR